jgi:hypothetical protein|nr:hypothetical protein [uncultured Mediterranean phage uvMED]|tara:strand:+ start:79 stop:348 length:270 start_codon:yes stop_codon:yes gene_type:complete
MIPAGLKAGSMALKMLRTLYKAKKGIRTGASTSSKFLATKGMDKSAKVAEAVGKKVTSGSRAVGKTIKKYPKSSSALAGAIGYDIFDND